MVADRPYHIAEGRTGRRRHRTQRRLFRDPLLILQVEETVGVYRDIPTPRSTGKEAINRYTIWRDAVPEDLMNERKPE